MKIGIITFWESKDNYGQVLQAYALQQILLDLGHQPFQIKYSLSGSRNSQQQRRAFIKIILKSITIYPLVLKYLRYRENRKNEKYKVEIEQKNKQRKFDIFRKKYIRSNSLIYQTITEIQNNPPEADCFITGSDQVWRMLLDNENNRAYFLDFGRRDIKRISYAASFSRSYYPKQYITQLKDLLSRFDAISVREYEGVDICKNVGISAIQVLDPTFLLKKASYLSLCLNKETKTDKYIYIYSINIQKSEEINWKEIVSYAKKNNYRLLATTSSGNIPGREILTGAEYIYATIPEWLSYVNGAKCVMTTSFHGVVFCLIMHTNFVYFPLCGKRAEGNGRVYSLLESIGLLHRICKKKNSLHEVLQNEINWDIVDMSLKEQREHCMKFLENSLT